MTLLALDVGFLFRAHLKRCFSRNGLGCGIGKVERNIRWWNLENHGICILLWLVSEFGLGSDIAGPERPVSS